MAKSNRIGTNYFNEDLNLLINFDTSEPINILLNSLIIPSLSNLINIPGSVTNIEQYDEKYDKITLNHLKAQIMREIRSELNVTSVFKRIQAIMKILLHYIKTK